MASTTLKQMLADHATGLDKLTEGAPAAPIPRRKRAMRRWCEKRQEYDRAMQVWLAKGAVLETLAASELPDPPVRGRNGQFLPRDEAS